jgi:nucleotide-binding universal stress UspA family protein
MFERVLAGLDLTPAAETVLHGLPRLRSLGTRSIVLAHVSEGLGDPLGDPETERKMHLARLEALGSFLERKGFEVDVRIEEGDPATMLVEMTREEGASLVVLGSRSRSRLREAFLGSVAMDVLRAATTPVLLLHVGADAVDEAPSPAAAVDAPPFGDRVLFATDFSESAADAFTWVERIAAARGGRFDLLHATPLALEESPDAEEELPLLAERLDRAGAREVRSTVVRPAPPEAILRAAASDPPPLVVMGTHGRGFLGRAVLGSVARAVAQETRAPLLLVPPRKRR